MLRASQIYWRRVSESSAQGLPRLLGFCANFQSPHRLPPGRVAPALHAECLLGGCRAGASHRTAGGGRLEGSWSLRGVCVRGRLVCWSQPSSLGRPTFCLTATPRRHGMVVASSSVLLRLRFLGRNEVCSCFATSLHIFWTINAARASVHKEWL